MPMNDVMLGYPQVASPVAGGPSSLDPNSLASIQQNFSRAFIQSAVAQNLQIQQQLMAQNQALTQLLHQSVCMTGPPNNKHKLKSISCNLLVFFPSDHFPSITNLFTCTVNRTHDFSRATYPHLQSTRPGSTFGNFFTLFDFTSTIIIF